MREQARLEVHAHDPGDQGAGKEDHRREREDLDDLVRPVPRPGDQDVERSVDALADVARTFERPLVPVARGARTVAQSPRRRGLRAPDGRVRAAATGERRAIAAACRPAIAASRDARSRPRDRSRHASLASRPARARPRSARTQSSARRAPTRATRRGTSARRGRPFGPSPRRARRTGRAPPPGARGPSRPSSRPPRTRSRSAPSRPSCAGSRGGDVDVLTPVPKETPSLGSMSLSTLSSSRPSSFATSSTSSRDGSRRSTHSSIEPLRRPGLSARASSCSARSPSKRIVLITKRRSTGICSVRASL